jgi:effector-binding domain-containing protein
MKALRIILIGLLSLVGIYLLAAAFMPSTYVVTRSKEIPVAQEAAAKSLMNDFNNWPKWMPWQEMDATMKQTVEGTPAEPGHKMSWKSEKMGNGSMMISDISEKDQNWTQSMVLNFEGFPPGKSVLALEPSSNGMAKVTWIDSGNVGFFFRPMALMMDGMMGKDFERGLNKIDSISKAMPAMPAGKPTSVREEMFKDQPVMMTQIAVGDLKTVSERMAAGYGKILAVIKAQGLKEAGYPFCMLRSDNDPKWSLGIPTNKVGKDSEGCIARNMPGHKTLVTDYYGPYSGTQSARMALAAEASKRNLTGPGGFLEEYVSDPMTTTDESKLLTRVYMSVN